MTIHMSKEKADKWLAALRSGEYKQGVEALEEVTETGTHVGYCCLGVLQVCLSGSVEVGRGTPSTEWLLANGVNFGHFPDAHSAWDNRETSIRTTPLASIDGEYSSVDIFNDNHVPFTVIADALEAEMVYTDHPFDVGTTTP